MQLSVEVNNSHDVAVLVCRGQILQGESSEYLFALATRPDQRDVVLDVEAVSGIDEAGFFVILVCYQLLSAAKRRLFLRNPSSDVLEGLRRTQLDVLPDKLERIAPGTNDGTIQ